MTRGPEGWTVLVTGGAGFVGSHLVAALAPDNEVRVLDDFSTGARANVPDGVTVVEGDVTDPDALAAAADGVDCIFHQAAVASVEASLDDPVTCHEVNLTGTLAVLERARAAGARVVFASSAAIYGHPESLPVAESAPKSPRSPYGVTKLAADHYCRLYDDLYDTETVSLRYFNVYGPGRGVPQRAGVVSAFVERARNGDPIPVEGGGDQRRDFVHVDDVVRANLLAATTDHTGEAFNVATGESTSVRELASLVADLTDAETPVVRREAREGDIDRSRADVSKARERLGFESAVSLREGLRELLGAGATA